MQSRFLIALFATVGLAWTAETAVAADHCEKLDPAKKAQATAIMGGIHPHDCCDETLDKCLAKANPSRLVKRLANEVCRLVAAGKDASKIKRAMERRAESMLGTGRKAKIDTSEVAWAGAADAKVSVVGYACARCPFCSKSIPMLHDKVESGDLKGKARFALRPFPLRSHEGSAPAAFGFEAARQLGKFWPLVLKVYAEFKSFAVAKLADWAAALGMAKADFTTKMDDPATRKTVEKAKKEGLRNGVKATPTYFINGKRYTGDLEKPALVDAIHEEFDRVEGQLCKP